MLRDKILYLCIAAVFAMMPRQALAVIYSVEVCLEFETNFTDVAGGDFWTTNADRAARGVWLVVEETVSGTKIWEDYTSDTAGDYGCATMNLDSTVAYDAYALSKAEVNGIELNAYDDQTTPDLDTEVLVSSWSPTSSTTVYGHLPADTLYAQLAVGTWAMSRNTMGMASTNPLDFYDDACCSAGDKIKASTFSKFIIAHELGHAVGYRRDGNQGPNFDYSAAEDNCDGDGRSSGHSQVSKEYQSGAAVEGWADFYAAWTWNSSNHSDCTYDRQYASDFDLKNGVDNGGAEAGQTNCEGVPDTGLESYVTAKDWLEDLVNASDPAGCTGTLVNRSTQYDWLRFWWDMLTDQSIPPRDLADIYDDMNPQSFDDDGSTGTTADDPIVRLEESCDDNGYASEWSTEKNHGMDH